MPVGIGTVTLPAFMRQIVRMQAGRGQVKTASTTIFSMVALVLSLAAPALAQTCNLSGQAITSLRDPLIFGSTSSAPFNAAPIGQPPPVGDSSVPAPVNPGMIGPPTLIPSVPTTPANDIDNPSVEINFLPTNLSAPGQLGPSITAPPPASTPGTDPGIIVAPLDFTMPPAAVVNINPGGGISGTPPTQRWGGQTSADFGLYRHNGVQTDDNGVQETGSNSQDGLNHARTGASTTQDLFGSRYPLKNSGVSPYQATTTNQATATN
jgi:hypothetical protein